MSGFTQTVGIIGLGRMGRCLISGLIELNPAIRDLLRFTTKHSETAEQVQKDYGIRKFQTNVELAKNAKIILLAIKPQNIDEVLNEISGHVRRDALIISIVAGIATQMIEKQIRTKTRVIRAMPNTPALVRSGMTALCRGRFSTDEDFEIAEQIFSPLGRVVRVDERHMNAVTGLSGCGPAYIYVVLEALTEAGIKVGLPRDLATKLSAQTVLGAAQMLLITGRHPAELKDEVTTPAGCTIDGLVELEEGKLRVTLMKAVVRATERAKALASRPE